MVSGRVSQLLLDRHDCYQYAPGWFMRTPHRSLETNTPQLPFHQLIVLAAIKNQEETLKPVSLGAMAFLITAGEL
jgi:hypothetical protein